MSRGHRRVIAALGALALLATLGVLTNYKIEQLRDRENAAEARNDYAAYQEACERLVPAGPMVPNCLIEQVHTAHEEKHTEADLKAQQDVALWTFILMVAGVVGTAVSVGALVLLLRNLEQVNEANAQATRTADAADATLRSTRAWVGVKRVVKQRIFERTKSGALECVAIGFTIEWTNYGQSPARPTGAWSGFETWSNAPQFDDIDVRWMPKPPGRFGILGNGAIFTTPQVVINRSYIEDVAANKWRVCVVGRTTYRTVFDSEADEMRESQYCSALCVDGEIDWNATTGDIPISFQLFGSRHNFST